VTIQEAKRIPLPFLLQQLGRNPHHQKSGEIWYISPFRDEEKPSFKVNRARNVWFDFGLGKGGDGIKLIGQWTRCGDVSSALRAFAALVEGAPRPTRTPRSQPPQPALASLSASSRFRISRVGPLENQALVQYLQKRCLSSSTAARYVREIHYAYESRNFFALAFPSRRGGFELRNRYFKGAFGPKAITVLNARQGAEALGVFEGFMDFLSALAYYQAVAPRGPVVILNSTALRDQALETIRSLRPRLAHLYFDRDETGRLLTREAMARLPGVQLIDPSNLYEGHKDFNDFLVARGRRP
jgi:DNA primase